MKSTALKFLLAGCAAALLAPAALHAAPRVDPQALASLKRMSDTLAAAKAFTYQSQTISEVPAKNGQFLTVFSTWDVALKRPDKLRAHLAGGAPHFDFYYDGATAAAFAPGTKVFSSSKAPGTIDAMLPALEHETGIRLAPAGLLFSDPYKALTSDVTSGLYVGRDEVNGIPCDHLAFRGRGVNWEIWIESGPRALPLRLAVTYADRPNFPRVLVEFSRWNLHPGLKPGNFAFCPPAGSREIPFRSLLKR
ncbi:MAG: DUF2092 domain-containing protein [Verrucomicrobiae bacterium]